MAVTTAVLPATNLTTTSATPATGIASLLGSANSSSAPQALGTLTQFQISGAYGTVTFAFTGTFDGSVWFPVAAELAADRTPQNGTIAPADNLTATYLINSAGLVGVRLSVSAIASGTLVVTAQSGSYVGVPTISSSAVTTYGAITATSLTASGLIKSTSPTAGIGYATGAGGAVTQSTDKSTTVVSNTITTAITMNAANLAAATIVGFTFTNSSIAATDSVIVTHQSAGTGGAYTFNAFPGSGSAVISVRNNTAGGLAEAIVLRVTVIKAVSA